MEDGLGIKNLDLRNTQRCSPVISMVSWDTTKYVSGSRDTGGKMRPCQHYLSSAIDGCMAKQRVVFSSPRDDSHGLTLET